MSKFREELAEKKSELVEFYKAGKYRTEEERKIRNRIDELQRQILIDEATWPQVVTFYISANEDMVYEQGWEMGLDHEALEKFSYALYEIKVELEVYKDGTYKILSINDQGNEHVGK
jgi:hypothetical protein